MYQAGSQREFSLMRLELRPVSFQMCVFFISVKCMSELDELISPKQPKCVCVYTIVHSPSLRCCVFSVRCLHCFSWSDVIYIVCSLVVPWSGPLKQTTANEIWASGDAISLLGEENLINGKIINLASSK